MLGEEGEGSWAGELEQRTGIQEKVRAGVNEDEKPGSISKRVGWEQALGWCSPWQWLVFVLFPVWPARAGAALGLGVPQLTVKPFSDSERRGLSQL